MTPLALQQTTAPTPPIPPLPGQAGDAVRDVQVVVQDLPPGVPRSREEVLAMRAQRTELSNQLQSAVGRRSELAEQLENATPVERAGLEARIAQLDDRILRIESEIDRTGELIAQAPGQFLVRQPDPDSGGPMRPDVTAIAVVFTVFVLAPIALAAARLLWKRATQGPRPPAIDHETAERLRRLESGVDAIAIEVERISEGQRFVTKLMAEREQQRLGVPRQ